MPKGQTHPGWNGPQAAGRGSVSGWAGLGDTGTHCVREGASCRSPAYLLVLHGERTHIPRQVHLAEVLRAIAVDTVGVVAGANEHGAEQRAEVEAVPLLVLEHRGGGVQVRGLAGDGWSATAGQHRRPRSTPTSPSIPIGQQLGTGPVHRLDPHPFPGSPALSSWEPPKNGMGATACVESTTHICLYF